LAIFQEYARYYDDLYRDKDYPAECSFLEDVFTTFSDKAVKSVLDLGCGTGGHGLLLAERGFRITAVDLSQQMIAVARKHAQQRGLEIDIQQADIRHLDLGKKFDAVIAMFAVIGYQITNDDVLSTFHAARKHLDTGGVFTFDVWFGPAVLSIRPEERFKVIKNDENGGQIIRLAKPQLDIMGHFVQVDYTIYQIEKDRIVSQVQESHRNRFYFPKELEMFLDNCGFQCRKICPFMKLGQECTTRDWNVSVVATAR